MSGGRGEWCSNPGTRGRGRQCPAAGPRRGSHGHWWPKVQSSISHWVSVEMWLSGGLLLDCSLDKTEHQLRGTGLSREEQALKEEEHKEEQEEEQGQEDRTRKD